MAIAAEHVVHDPYVVSYKPVDPIFIFINVFLCLMFFRKHVFHCIRRLSKSFRYRNYQIACRQISYLHNTTMSYAITERGSLNSESYRIFFCDNNGPISPFHDIPLFADKENKIYNMIVEVPRWTNAKMEIATKEPLNPIKQDTKKGMLRFVHNCFPHHGYIWNYGALPQTWEDPNHTDESTGCKGDNDPIDVCEIGYRVAKRGEVIQVKILGVFALVDEGETDWKLIAINIADPMADELNDIEDVEKHMPGFLRATNEWFRIYKIPGGNPENKFAFNGEPKNKEFAEKIIDETHQFWQKLIKSETDANDLNCSTVTLEGSPFKIEIADAVSIIQQTEEHGPPHIIDPIVDKWHFVHLLK